MKTTASKINFLIMTANKNMTYQSKFLEHIVDVVRFEDKRCVTELFILNSCRLP